MDKTGVLGKIGDLGVKAGSVIGGEAKTIAKTIHSQITGEELREKPIVPEKSSVSQLSGQNTKPLKEQNQAIVKEIYGIKKDEVPPSKEQAAVQSNISKTKDEQKIQELRALAQRLHKETYYDPIIAYEKKKEGQGEEAKAEKPEREEKEEEQEKMQLEQKKAKDDQDIATTRAKTAVEANRGVAG